MGDSIVQSLGPNPRVLIIKPSSLGDVVHALPVLAALRDARPDAHIAWLVGNSFAPLIEGHPLLNEVIRFDRARYGRMLQNPRIMTEFLRFVGGIRRQRFDLVIDLQGLARSGFLTYASGAKQRVGFAEARELAWMGYNRRVRCDSSAVHAVDRNMCIASAIGLSPRQAQFPLLITDAERSQARGKLEDRSGGITSKFVAVIPGARWETKLWSARAFGELIAGMNAAGFPPAVLLGAPNDRGLAGEALAAAPAAAKCIDMTGRTSLREMAAMIDLSSAVVCLDSGPMHVAVALRKPIVALLGPTDAARTGPYVFRDGATQSRIQVLTAGVECAPCLNRRCPYSPNDQAHHMACMRRIGVEQVLRAVRTALGQVVESVTT